MKTLQYYPVCLLNTLLKQVQDYSVGVLLHMHQKLILKSALNVSVYWNLMQIIMAPRQTLCFSYTHKREKLVFVMYITFVSKQKL